MNASAPTLNDHLMASGMVSRAFMMQLLVEMARRQDDPLEWARSFVSDMTARVDQNEITVDDRRFPVHELARHQIDTLGQDLERVLPLYLRS